MSKTSDQKTSPHRPVGFWYWIVVLGWAIYLISLSVPAVNTEGFLFFSDTEPGIGAATWAIMDIGSIFAVDEHGSVYWAVSGLTNLLFLSTIVSLIRRKPSAGIGVLLLGSVLFNLGWLLEPSGTVDVSRDQLLFGYYLWIASYVLVGVGQSAWGWKRSTS